MSADSVSGAEAQSDGRTDLQISFGLLLALFALHSADLAELLLRFASDVRCLASFSACESNYTAHALGYARLLDDCQVLDVSGRGDVPIAISVTADRKTATDSRSTTKFHGCLPPFGIADIRCHLIDVELESYDSDRVRIGFAEHSSQSWDLVSGLELQLLAVDGDIFSDPIVTDRFNFLHFAASDRTLV